MHSIELQVGVAEGTRTNATSSLSIHDQHPCLKPIADFASFKDTLYPSCKVLHAYESSYDVTFGFVIHSGMNVNVTVKKAACEEC